MPDNDLGVPAAQDTQQPRRGTEGSAPPSGAEGDETSSQDTDTPSVRDPSAKALADAEARYRKQLRDAERKIAEFEAEKQAAEDAKLSELEKANKRAATLQEELAQTQLRYQQALISDRVEATATELGISAKLAMRLLPHEAIEFDEATGKPTNIPALLQAALEEYGLAAPAAADAAPAAQQQQLPGSNGQPGQNGRQIPPFGATNPSRGSQVAAANGTFTRGEMPRSVLDGRLWKKPGS